MFNRLQLLQLQTATRLQLYPIMVIIEICSVDGVDIFYVKKSHNEIFSIQLKNVIWV